MSARVTINCRACTSRLVTTDMTELKAWNDGHDEKCPGPVPEAAALAPDDPMGWGVAEMDKGMVRIVHGTDLDDRNQAFGLAASLESRYPRAEFVVVQLVEVPRG